MYLYDPPASRSKAPSSNGYGLFAQGGTLRRFAPPEILLTPEEALAVLRFFWPEADTSRLGALTDRDREFAQALLLEAVDASCTLGIAEEMYRRFFMKVPTSFASIARAAAKVARRAIENRLLQRCQNLDPSQVRIYESVRVSLARNFRSAWYTRLQGGELTY